MDEEGISLPAGNTPVSLSRTAPASRRIMVNTSVIDMQVTLCQNESFRAIELVHKSKIMRCDND